ncbi:DNA photolyase phr1 [Friedmanniomyces endolithicus]|nr:DNA photolyase phr1 [Friedmanniomyces endolithicus]KAK0796230.1 DNA photolyase phr1 [Friedmanniomyces endolithicus]KAK0812404.1 DNA photolyase phr1 [Friedmanniomyces endolithicus]KAK0817527.1 DNA photolyase phr1 [Friedmanniomyces endolithicus]KAK0856296.1 DNA photolyase phr1 [Friedmanniomyces endolithicus]
MATKRKVARATSPIRPEPAKRPRQTELVDDSSDQSRAVEQYGYVQREFYPAEMSNERCKQYNNNELPRPIETLNRALEDTKLQRSQIAGGEAVVHWFKRDLRTTDNRALSLASAKAKSLGVPLVCMFIVSPQDYQAHLTSPARVDFELRTLEVMKADLAEKDIPLYATTIQERREVPGHMLHKFEEWGAKHIFCNIEYEVDELRREAKLVKRCLDKGVSFTAVHDDVVVPPGTLKSGAGKQYSVYSPWLKAWTKHLHEHPHLLEASSPPTPNPPTARKTFPTLFSSPIPEAPPNKYLPPETRTHLAHLWPAGEHAALTRLDHYLTTKASAYKTSRNFPATPATAMLSVHFSAGTLAARTAVRCAREANKPAQRLETGDAGLVCWISELAWRDFYKHILAQWPFVCMAKPFKYEYSGIEWDSSPQLFAKWCEGKTGYPIVDAAMRQLNTMGWMHNRCRMIVASFLAKDLLLDWRLGERYFMEKLIDGDFASNNGGWGFSASTGVDPQPYFRIFNPLLQSEKFDEGGEYIRKWVPELKGVMGKAVHDPYGRGAGAEAEKWGYPRMVVEHKVQRERALERYKKGLGRGTANLGGGVHN